jgi:hypothetical protein
MSLDTGGIEGRVMGSRGDVSRSRSNEAAVERSLEVNGSEQEMKRSDISCRIYVFVSGAMKLTVGLPIPRVNRKVMKGLATKRTAVGQQRLMPGERMCLI